MRLFCTYLVLLVGSVGFCQPATSIFDIARNGNITQAAEIIKADPSAVDYKTPEGFTPLILACYRGNREVAKFLLDNGAAINKTSPMGSALMAAVVKNDSDIVKLLLSRKADTELTDTNGITALIYAVKFQNPEFVKLLLESGAKKTTVDNDGKTPFEYAAFSGNQAIIELLK